MSFYGLYTQKVSTEQPVQLKNRGNKDKFFDINQMTTLTNELITSSKGKITAKNPIENLISVRPWLRPAVSSLEAYPTPAL
jgi:hypothetical protein